MGTEQDKLKEKKVLKDRFVPTFFIWFFHVKPTNDNITIFKYYAGLFLICLLLPIVFFPFLCFNLAVVILTIYDNGKIKNISIIDTDPDNGVVPYLIMNFLSCIIWCLFSFLYFICSIGYNHINLNLFLYQSIFIYQFSLILSLILGVLIERTIFVLKKIKIKNIKIKISKKTIFNTKIVFVDTIEVIKDKQIKKETINKWKSIIKEK